MQYLQLLHKWNKAFNLTAVRDMETMVTRHLLDSMTIIPHIQGSRIIDVGTGGGLPGMPIAILKPEYDVTLLDANSKKIRFLTQTIFQMGLPNATAVHARVEKYKPDTAFNTVTSRAFTNLNNILTQCEHLVSRSAGIIAAQKAFDINVELSQISIDQWQYKIYETQVPSSEERRKTVILTKKP